MAKSESSRRVVRRLTEAGFQFKRNCEGSHVMYGKGKVSISVPLGHSEISPGVQRKIDRAINLAGS
jgi:predicted RNA binding protein YcfA (HicA-like mRNA interferase family)